MVVICRRDQLRRRAAFVIRRCPPSACSRIARSRRADNSSSISNREKLEQILEGLIVEFATHIICVPGREDRERVPLGTQPLNRTTTRRIVTGSKTNRPPFREGHHYRWRVRVISCRAGL